MHTWNLPTLLLCCKDCIWSSCIEEVHCKLLSIQYVMLLWVVSLLSDFTVQQLKICIWRLFLHHLDAEWWLQEFFLIFEPRKPLSPLPFVSYFVMEKCSSLRHSWVYNCLLIFSIFFFFSAYKTGMNRRTDLYLKENEHIRK